VNACIDCGRPAEWALIDERGELVGRICIQCDYKRRRNRMGWQRRLAITIRRLLDI
jgi:hypothetical protein